MLSCLFARVRNRTPMEIAYQRNQQLMAAYRERMTRMNKRDPGAASLVSKHCMCTCAYVCAHMHVFIGMNVSIRQLKVVFIFNDNTNQILHKSLGWSKNLC